MRHTDWFAKCGWGVFFRYLAAGPGVADTPGMTAEAWSRQVDAFNVEGLDYTPHNRLAGTKE